MVRYANKTRVPVGQSKTEIERILQRYGATQFMYGTDGNQVVICFRYDGRNIKYTMEYPDAHVNDMTQKQYEQAIRQMWRALVLIIKAKLEAIESGVTTFDQEFLASIMMPDGKTVGEHTLPAVDQAYLTGKMPKMLPGMG
jgi:hypothetical protein